MPPDDEPGRVRSDAEVYDRLAAQNFAGAEQEVFEAALVAYALRVIKGWIRTGKIYSQCAEHHRPVWPYEPERAALEHDPSERTEIALETVARALRDFREGGLRGGGWQPDGGRCLDAYFVTTCVLEFPTVFRRWCRERRRQPPHTGYGVDPVAAGLDTPPPDRPSDDPADVVLDRITMEQELETMRPEDRTMVLGVLGGRTHAQIGEELGMSAAAVGEALRRYRKSRRAGQAR